MGKLLAALIAMGFGLVLAFGARAIGPVGRVVRAVVMAMVGLMLLVGLTLGGLGLAEDVDWLAVIGAAVIAMAAFAGFVFHRTNRRLTALVASAGVPHVKLVADPRWTGLSRELGWKEREQANLARARIQAFLAERDSASLSPEQRQLMISCERRVPELLDTCLERCRRAAPAERRAYVDETLARLSQLGDEADEARRSVRAADDQRLTALHNYFDGVTGKDQPARP